LQVIPFNPVSLLLTDTPISFIKSSYYYYIVYLL